MKRMNPPETPSPLPIRGSYAQSVLLRQIWQELGRRYPPSSGQALLLYGAGKFTRRVLQQVMALPQGPLLAGIADDQAAPGQTLAGHPVRKPAGFARDSFAAVLLGTDSSEDAFARQCAAIYGADCVLLRYSELAAEALAIQKAKEQADRPDGFFHPNQGDPFLDVRALWQTAQALTQHHECNDFKDNLILAVAMNMKPANTERMTEYGFALMHLPPSGGRVLDIGSRNSRFPGVLADKGFHVTCLEPDLSASESQDARIALVHGDARESGLPDGQFDFITCISTLEHIGLPGRYGITEDDPNGDAKAMKEMCRLLKPGGRLILTVPFGQYALLPLNRVYTREKVMALKGALQCVAEECFCIDQEGTYKPATAQKASEADLRRDGYYALGCFVFERTNRGE